MYTPQYLIVNKTPTGGTKGTKHFWYPEKLESVDPQAINEIINIIGTDGSRNRRLGFGFMVPYLEDNVDSNAIVNRILKISLEKKMPILVKLDGVSWWETRSDLWNWWDKKMKGYDPENKKNVEWTSWSPKDAIKISWRNWGRQIRVKPHPNLGSKIYIQEKQNKLQTLIYIIVKWYNTLPQDKKYLLAGVVLDNELSIGINHYYYPNGDSYLNENPKNDPEKKPDFEKGYHMECVKLGYAAVKSMGIKKSGVLTLDDLNTAIKQHAEFLGKIAFDCGLSPDKTYIHGLGNSKKTPKKPFSYENVITPYGNPGWTIYDIVNKPSQSEQLTSALNRLGGRSWGAVEWNIFKRKKEMRVTHQWKNALLNSLDYCNCALVSIYNWEAISTRPAVIQAVNGVLKKSPQNWQYPALAKSRVSWWRWVSLTWKKPQNAERIQLWIATKPDLLPNGHFVNSDVVDENVTKQTVFRKFFTPGKYYWQIVCETTMPFRKSFKRGKFEILDLKSLLVKLISW